MTNLRPAADPRQPQPRIIGFLVLRRGVGRFAPRWSAVDYTDRLGALALRNAGAGARLISRYGEEWLLKVVYAEPQSGHDGGDMVSSLSQGGA